MWADDEIRMESSSGGAFSLLAEWILGEQGAVVGAVYDGSFSGKKVKGQGVFARLLTKYGIKVLDAEDIAEHK